MAGLHKSTLCNFSHGSIFGNRGFGMLKVSLSMNTKEISEIIEFCEHFKALSKGKTHTSQPDSEAGQPISIPPWRIEKLLTRAEGAGLVSREKLLSEKFNFVQHERTLLTRGEASHRIIMPVVEKILFEARQTLGLCG